MPKDARILFRGGRSFLTQIGDRDTPETIGQRMSTEGFIVCRDSRWGKMRTLIVNLADVTCIVIEEPKGE